MSSYESLLTSELDHVHCLLNPTLPSNIYPTRYLLDEMWGRNLRQDLLCAHWSASWSGRSYAGQHMESCPISWILPAVDLHSRVDRLLSYRNLLIPKIGERCPILTLAYSLRSDHHLNRSCVVCAVVYSPRQTDLLQCMTCWTLSTCMTTLKMRPTWGNLSAVEL